MFAPRNEAFEKLTDTAFDFLQSEAGRPTTQAILNFHIAPGVYSFADLLSFGDLATVASFYRNGHALIQVSQNVNGTTVLLSDRQPPIPLIYADVLANNGLLHLIGDIMPLPVIVATDAPSSADSPPFATQRPTPNSPDSGAIGGATLAACWLLTIGLLASA